MDTNKVHRDLHNTVALIALLTLVGLSLHDFHETFGSFCKQHEREIGQDAPNVFTYVLGVAYACLFYCEIQMHKRKGASMFRIVLHLVTLIIALLPHILKMLLVDKEPESVSASTQVASIVSLELTVAIVLFFSIEVVLAYLVWHINNPPNRGRRR